MNAAQKQLIKTAPKLAGSEKQIAWADQIRASKIPALEVVARNTGKTDTLQQLLSSKTDAKFWIDNRLMSVAAMLRG